MIYDPVANCGASMNYVMDVYNVLKDGSNLASNVQQADPSRNPRGY
jgi:SLT domain-containing protein